MCGSILICATTHFVVYCFMCKGCGCLCLYIVVNQRDMSMEANSPHLPIDGLCFFGRLPDEVILYIFRLVRFNRFTIWKNMVELERTCRTFHRLLKNPCLWRRFSNLRLTGWTDGSLIVCGQYTNLPPHRVLEVYLARVPSVETFYVNFNAMMDCGVQVSASEHVERAMLLHDVIRANNHKFGLSSIHMIIPETHHFLWLSNSLLSLNLAKVVKLFIQTGSAFTEGAAIWPLVRACTGRLNQLTLKVGITEHPTTTTLDFGTFFSMLRNQTITSLTLENVVFVRDRLLTGSSIGGTNCFSTLFARYPKLTVLNLVGLTTQVPRQDEETFNAVCGFLWFSMCFDKIEQYS